MNRMFLGRMCMYLTWTRDTTRRGSECVGCGRPLTVQHIVITCVDLHTKSILRFDSVGHSTVLLHIRAIRLFYKL